MNGDPGQLARRGVLAGAFLAAVLVPLVFLPWPRSAFGILFGVLAVRIAREDLERMIVPDGDVLLLLAAGLVGAGLGLVEGSDNLAPAGGWRRVGEATSRVFIVGGSAYVLAALYRLIRRREGLGLGDVKLAGAAGAWLPLASVLHAVTLAALAALAVLLVRAYAWGGRLDATTALPFAAFLAPAFWLVWLLGLF